MTVVVNTLQSEPRWAAAHVGQEGRVAVAPAFADRDAASAVIGEVFVIGVGTPGLHPGPDAVFAATAKSLAMPLPHSTATAQTVAGGQIAFFDKDGVGAVANTPIALPQGCSRQASAAEPVSKLWGALFKGLQQPEALTEDLDVFGHTVKGTLMVEA